MGDTEAMNTTNVAQQESTMQEIEPRTNHESCPLGTMDLKSLSPCSLSSQDTIHTPVEPIGDVMGMNALAQELIEEIVSRTSPLDACGNLSLVSRRFCSAAKSDHVWERFLPTDIISRRAVANDAYSWCMLEDPWKKIDSDTLHAFPTKKDLYLFLSEYNSLLIDDGAMRFWLEKPSGKKCYHILPHALSIPEPYMPYTISSTVEKYVQGQGQLPSAPPYPIYPKYRDDTTYEVELGDYFHKECSGDRELHMMLREEKSGIEKGGIALFGIVIRPKRCQKTS